VLDLGNQSSIGQCGARVHESNLHHHSCDHRAIVDGSLNQESVEALGLLHSDQCEAQHQEHMNHQDAVDASNLIAEVVDLKATVSLCLYLVRVPHSEALDHLCSGGKVVNRLKVLLVANP
jgi:hypothetical protein